MLWSNFGLCAFSITKFKYIHIRLKSEFIREYWRKTILFLFDSVHCKTIAKHKIQSKYISRKLNLSLCASNIQHPADYTINVWASRNIAENDLQNRNTNRMYSTLYVFVYWAHCEMWMIYNVQIERRMNMFMRDLSQYVPNSLWVITININNA